MRFSWSPSALRRGPIRFYYGRNGLSSMSTKLFGIFVIRLWGKDGRTGLSYIDGPGRFFNFRRNFAAEKRTSSGRATEVKAPKSALGVLGSIVLGLLKIATVFTTIILGIALMLMTGIIGG